jgi:hypothetical protein
VAYNDFFSGYRPQYREGNRFGIVTGVTKDAAGAALGGCTVRTYVAATNAPFSTVVSDGSGNYSATVPLSENCYLVAYKAGSPDVAGTTVNYIQGV